jgi:hypothetical protein
LESVCSAADDSDCAMAAVPFFQSANGSVTTEARHPFLLQMTRISSAVLPAKIRRKIGAICVGRSVSMTNPATKCGATTRTNIIASS